MEHYSLLRELADSWALMLMTAIFLGVIVWVIRPGSRALHDDAARSIFEHDDKPAPGPSRTPAKERQT